MSHFPRVPVRFLIDNHDLLKSQAGVGTPSGGAGSVTDYRQTEELPVLTTIPGDTYNAPAPGARVNGNEIARRYPDGTLDIDYMKHKVIDALHIVKNKGTLNSVEEIALSVLFPSVFMFIDPLMTDYMTKVNLRITPFEATEVAMAVAEHLCKEHEYLLHARQ